MIKNINFVSKFKIANIASITIFILSAIFIVFKGLNYGIDFKGGTLIELRAEKKLETSSIRETLNLMDLGDVNVKKFGKDGDYLIKIEQKSNKNSNIIGEIKKNLSTNLNTNVDFRRVENVGPKVSSELLKSSIIAISLALAAMLFYIWIRFEWQFSFAAILALIHDVIITIGTFSLLAYEMNLSIIAAILTIVGYPMNDTVVIFDRIRENLRKYDKLSIKEISDLSTNETLSRTLITSITTLLALFSIYFFGGEILKGFSFAMILGVIVGTYSSIFIATPILYFTKVNQSSVAKEKNLNN